MLDWVSNAFSSVNAAREITTSLLTLRDEELVRTRVFDLTSNLMDLQQQMMNAQLEQMELIKRIGELETQIAETKAQSNILDRYDLHKFDSGYYAYKLKSDHAQNGTEHYACSNCFEQGDVVTMQFTSGSTWTGLRCPRCKMQIALASRPVRPIPRPSIW